MLRRLLRSLALPPLAGFALAVPALREAPNMSAVAVNQLVVSGNACGPAALLNAFRSGNPDWQRPANALVGANDKERILTLIREIAMRPSNHTPGHPRWSRNGVSVADLRDMANEMIAGQYLPQLSQEVFFLQPGETPGKLLQRIYQRFDTSLAKGLPPVVSLRRFVWRQASGKAPQWLVIDAHFVTLTAIPRVLDKNARSFPVSYIDPWGARRCQGSIGIPGPAVFANAAGHPSCMEADFPHTSVAKKLVRRGELSVLAVAAAIGRW